MVLFRTMRSTLSAFTILLFFAIQTFSVPAAVLAEFSIEEPIGQNWTGEWLTREIELSIDGAAVRAGSLQLVQGDGTALPCQFYGVDSGNPLGPDQSLSNGARVKVLFRATISKGETVEFSVRDDAESPRPWEPVTVRENGSQITVANGEYTVEFDAGRPLPVNAMRCAGSEQSLGTFHWPEGVKVTRVEETITERGPARAIIERTFRFANPDQHYSLTFDFRAEDPWIDIEEHYDLGKGKRIEIDLRKLKPDVVYHEYAYNARTFRPGGETEDSTLEPPQDPIATLGPIWRDIWYGGGPFAYVYRKGVDCGIGFAAVRGSEWEAPTWVTMESQNLEIHGDPKIPGQVRVALPADGLKRHWAIIIGPPEVRKRITRMIRSHADIPLNKVLHEWILEWESDAPEVGDAGAGVYLGSHFNRHFFNPTTFPRSVRSRLDKMFEHDEVYSPGLAALAYIFMDPNYWPGPDYRWRINNPNFHTDMYNIPLKVGALMPDHPHAKRWLEWGRDETRGDLMRNSYPGGAWQESLSYSGYVFHMVDNARIVRDSGLVNPFAEWPRMKEVLTYLAAMHTPVDPRYGSRQKAPIGDTSPGNYIEELRECAADYRGVDDRFADQLARFPESWEGALDLGSREFFGFGAMMRGSQYDERNESFLTVKAGPARNHYQGDELSFYFASMGTPLAIDYACHYSPRPWHAAIHNRPDMNHKRPVAIAVRRAMKTSDAADVFVADERTTRISHVPLEPHQTTKPGWKYPMEELPVEKAWTMRRYAMLVKHDPESSRIPDYLVVRDEILSPEPVWWNLHVLGREIERDGQSFRFPGQLDVDLAAHFLAPGVGDTQNRQWGWRSDVEGRRTLKGDEYERQIFGAWIPEDFERGSWSGNRGEMARWLRVKGNAGDTQWLVVLMPNRKGDAAPKVERLSETSARITLGNESEVVHLGSDGQWQAAIERNGEQAVLLEAGEVKPWSALEFSAAPPSGHPDVRDP